MVGEVIVNNVLKYEWDEIDRTFKVKCLDGSRLIYHDVVEFKIVESCREHFTVKIRYGEFTRYDLMTKTTKETIKEVAKEVVEGKWGYGAERKHRLEEAGFDYIEVQLEANRLLYVPYKPESKIKNAIFNDPATIVFWADGTKTVVKCGENDIYDPEKGLAMAVAKKYLGTNKSHSNYMDEFKKWLPKDEWQPDTFEDFGDSIKKLAEIGSSLKEKEHD